MQQHVNHELQIPNQQYNKNVTLQNSWDFLKPTWYSIAAHMQFMFTVLLVPQFSPRE